MSIPRVGLTENKAERSQFTNNLRDSRNILISVVRLTAGSQHEKWSVSGPAEMQPSTVYTPVQKRYEKLYTTNPRAYVWVLLVQCEWPQQLQQQQVESLSFFYKIKNSVPAVRSGIQTAARQLSMSGLVTQIIHLS